MARLNIPVYAHRTATPMPIEDADHVHPFVIVGSGPVGLTLALDMAQKGHPIVLLTAFEFISAGSKGICYAKQTLDIFDRLGIGEKVVEKGVVWNVGKVYRGMNPEPVYQFDMLPVKGQKNPGFVNIQQYYIETFLLEALEALDNVDIRWGHTVEDIETLNNKARLTVSTQQGKYTVAARYVAACDGSKSGIRSAMGLEFEGRIFEDHFLIADIRIEEDRPSERLFWFDPPFKDKSTALYHKQPDDTWRLDFQLGWDIDKEKAILPENVDPLIRGMLGDDVAYEEVWYSVYTFQCRRMQTFLHGPVIFAGDSAHLVSPFGARGANSGIADADNLAWKLDLVLKGKAPASLLESYNYERTMAADENILHSSRSTDFITPKNHIAKLFRDAVLELSEEHAFARPYINSGRLSTPSAYYDSPLSTYTDDVWVAGPPPGFMCVDAPLDGKGGTHWLLESLGTEFKLLAFGKEEIPIDIPVIYLGKNAAAIERYGAGDGGVYLVRPDQIVAARWKQADVEQIKAALRKALGQ